MQRQKELILKLQKNGITIISGPTVKIKTIPPEKRNVNHVRVPKEDAMCLLLHWHESLMALFEVKHPWKIDTIASITYILWTMHIALKQEINYSDEMMNTITDDHDFECNGFVIAWECIKPVIKNIAGLYQFHYVTTEQGKKDIELIDSLLALFNCYPLRVKELRLGTREIKVQTGKDVIEELPVREYGVELDHEVLVRGCTYPPHLQWRMKSMLGPMTIAINLALETNTSRQKSWKEAFVQVFKLYPHVEELADLIAGSKKQHIDILSKIALIYGNINTFKQATFPFAMFLSVARQIESYKNFFHNTVPKYAMLRSMVHPSIRYIKFSGNGAYVFWHDACKEKYAIKSAMTTMAQTMRELVFHAVWGTEYENIALLDFMTGFRFRRHHEIKNELFFYGELEEDYQFELITFQIVSEPANCGRIDYLEKLEPLPEYYQNDNIDTEKKQLPSKMKLYDALTSVEQFVDAATRKERFYLAETVILYEVNSIGGYGVKIDMPKLQLRNFY